MPCTHCAATVDIRTTQKGFLEPGRTKTCLQGNTVFANVLSKSSVCRIRRLCSHHSREKTKTKQKNLKTEFPFVPFPASSFWEEESALCLEVMSFHPAQRPKQSPCYTLPNTLFFLFCMQICCCHEKKYLPFTTFKATAKK